MTDSSSPEVKLLHPSGDMDLPSNAVLPISFAARDPDFMLRSIRLKFEHREMPLEAKTRHLYDAPPYQPEYQGQGEIRLSDFESAANLHRQARTRGGTVRKLMDCLIAAVAISRKMKRGMSPEKALAALTSADIEAAASVAGRDQRYKRLLRKLKLRRSKKNTGS